MKWMLREFSSERPCMAISINLETPVGPPKKVSSGCLATWTKSQTSCNVYIHCFLLSRYPREINDVFAQPLLSQFHFFCFSCATLHASPHHRQRCAHDNHGGDPALCQRLVCLDQQGHSWHGWRRPGEDDVIRVDVILSGRHHHSGGLPDGGWYWVLQQWRDSHLHNGRRSAMQQRRQLPHPLQRLPD